MTLAEVEKLLGDDFISIKRGCIVSAMAVHSVTNRINLCNGEELDYVVRRKREILKKLHRKQEEIIGGFREDGMPETVEEYQQYFGILESLPCAFTDIEMAAML